VSGKVLSTTAAGYPSKDNCYNPNPFRDVRIVHTEIIRADRVLQD
jgi:hypothetical protein